MSDPTPSPAVIRMIGALVEKGYLWTDDTGDADASLDDIAAIIERETRCGILAETIRIIHVNALNGLGRDERLVLDDILKLCAHALSKEEQ